MDMQLSRARARVEQLKGIKQQLTNIVRSRRICV